MTATHHRRMQPVDHDPFSGGALSRIVPTTEPQREVWLADQLGTQASLAFNESVRLQLRGALDVASLAAGVQRLVDRHEALRASIGPDGETLCIAQAPGVVLDTIDLTALDAGARADAVARMQRAAVDTPFALGSGPLFRAQLLVLGNDAHRLILTAHHIVCDGWSWWLLVRELASIYAQLTGHDAPSLDAPASFADYALAQATRGRDAQLVEDERYWLSRFADEVPVLDLPTDRPRPSRRTFASMREDHLLDATLTADIKRLGARRGASLFATLLGAFAATLARLSAQPRVVIGIPAAGQSADGLANLVGHCVNLLPLRFDIDPAMPVHVLLGDAQETLLDALDHQRYTFGTLLKKLRVDRDPGRLPLVSVMFNIDQAVDRDAHRFSGLVAEFATNPRTFENFELFVNAVQCEQGLQLECQYNADLFDAATVRRWMRGFECLLRHAIRQPESALGSLPIVDADALRELAALQPAPTPFDRECAMHQLFERQCDRTPERTALRHGNVACTYAQLDARANRIAALLRARGAHRGTLVGLAVDRGPDMLAALLGILKTGAGYVPLDPAFPAERLVYMVGDAGLAALVTQRAHAAQFDLRGRPVLVLDALDDALAAASPQRVAHAGDPESIAYVIYTSGSTGKPKGVQVPHRAVANFITAMQARPGIAADDRLVAVTTLSFDIAVLELLLPLSVGGEVTIADRSTAMDGPALAALLRERGATLMQATPATWRMLVDVGWQGHAGFRALCGGEALPADLAHALLARSAEVWNLYGPTETTVWSTCWRVVEPDRGVSIGTPIANTTVRVLDAQGQPCPLGVPGELCIGGDGVTLGYLGRDDLTAEKFVVDAFVQADDPRADARLYRTGDRGRWRIDGTLEHLGRLDFQVKVRGYRIELGEIETALVQRGGVAQAVALVREDRVGDVRIVAYAVMCAGVAFDEPAVIDALRDALPDYMLPQHVVAIGALPLLPNGKVDRKSLPAPGVGARSDALVAPRSDVERAIAAAMAQVLGVAEIGIHDNFFALGGHSLLAAQLTSRLNRELGLGLTLRALFDGPSVAQLAAMASDATADGDAAARQAIVRQPDQSRAPLSLMQERLWMLAQLAPGQLTYNTPSAHRLLGALDVAAFVRAFDAVVERQSVLRTSIVEVDGAPVQVVHDRVDSGLLPPIDLTHLPADAREQAMHAQIDALLHVPIALTSAPMFTARLFKLDAGEHVLLFMPHHAIWDGWSFDLLYVDLSDTYAAFERGEQPALPPLPVSYGDFAIWHRAWVEGPEYAAQLQFWRGHLGGGALRALPTDHPRTPGMSGEARALPVALPRTLADRLHGSALALESTLFIVLLSAYYALIGAAGGQREIIIGTPVRGRNSDQTEGLMGYFTNLLPLRVAVDPALPFGDFVRRVKAAVLDGFAHPDVRLEDLMRELSVRGADGGTVLYHSLFSFQDIRHRTMRWGSLRHQRVETATPGATEDLGLWLVESDGGLSGAMNYNVDLFDADTAELLRQRFTAMLESLARDPSQSVEALTRFDDGHPAVIGTAIEPTRAARSATAAAYASTTDTVATLSASMAQRGKGASVSTVEAQGDPLCALIAGVLAELLGRDAVAHDDDFFALGGHSLQAVQLFHRLGRATGVNLPLATLLSASTARELGAAYAAAGAHVPTAALPAVRAGDPWRPLVLMRAGSDAAPLFFIHAVGGNVLNYRPLATQMPDGMPVYGLQAFGLDGRTPPLTRIDDMARRYIEEIRSVQPVGPYHLAGGSMGGMIAYEIARQLVANGERVDLLGLIDTSSTYGRSLRTLAADQPTRWRQLIQRMQGMSPGDALRTLVQRVRVRRDTARARRRIAELRGRGDEVPHDLRYADIEIAHFGAYRDYVVEPYSGALTLFRAQQQPGGSGDDSLGWQDMVGSLQIFSIPGDHYNIVEAPQLAQALRASLDTARGRRAAVAGEVSASALPTPADVPHAHRDDGPREDGRREGSGDGRPRAHAGRVPTARA